MSKTIDSKVVEMRFDNRHFEQNVQTSINSIDKLNKSLDMSGATKGLQDVDAAAKRVDMSGLGSAVDTVQAKFSAMQVMAVTALANITNSAVNAGKRIVSALAIDPIKTGLSEYETKINAIQVIKANTRGKNDMNDITSALDDLNEYADKTIYNFAQMTNNIGKFTAQGYDVKAAANAVKGLANLAAASGASAEDMARATYQMSQAMGGTIRMMDWNSLRNANMATQELKNTLIDLAKVNDIAIDDMIEKHGTFEQTLQEGWLTGDMFTQAMNIYSGVYSDAELKDMGFNADQIKNFKELAKMAEEAATEVKTFTQLWDVLKETAQSGWTQTWELIIGDFDEAKAMWGGVYKTISGLLEATAEARNKLLKGWKDAGGRDDLMASFVNIYNGLKEVIVPIKDAFRDIFPPMTVDQLVGFTKGLKELTAKFKISDETADKIRRTFKGLFALLDIGKQIIFGVFDAIGQFSGGFGKLSGGILGVTATFGDWLVALDETLKKGQVFSKIFKTIGSAIGFTMDALGLFAGWLTESIIIPLLGLSDAAGGVAGDITSSFASMGSALANSGFVRVLKSIWNITKKLASGIAGAIGKLMHGTADFLDTLNFDKVLGMINSVSVAGILAFFVKFTKGFSDVAGTLGNFKESVIGILDEVKGCFTAYQEQIKADVLKKIAISIAILVASILVLSLIDPEKLASAVTALTVLFAELLGATAIFGKIQGIDKKVGKTIMSMIAIAIAVNILAGALKKLSGIESGDLFRGVAAVGLLCLELVLVSKILGRTKNSLLSTASLILFATSIRVLADAVAEIGKLDTKSMMRGMVGVTVLIAELVVVMKMMNSVTKNPMIAVNLIALAGAMSILAGVVKLLGSMSWNEIARGLTALGVSMLTLAVSMKLLPKIVSARLTLALIGLAGAMAILAVALQVLSRLSWDEISRGLTAMSVSLLAMTAAMKLMPKRISVNLALGLVALAGAMAVLTGVMYVIGNMSWDSIIKGLVGIAGALLIISIAMKQMRTAILGATALMVITASLALLLPVLVTLGSMPISTLIQGLLALAGVLAIFGIAASVLSPVIPAMIALGAAIVILGVGCMAAGAGILMLSTGLAALGGSAAVIAKSLKTIFTELLSLVPELFRQLGAAIGAFAEALLGSLPAVMVAVKEVILSLCDLLVECIPILADTILKLVVGLLDALVSYTPQIVDGIFNFLVGLIDGIARNIPTLIQSLVDLMMSILQGVIDAMKNIDPNFLLEAMGAIKIMAAFMIGLAALGLLAPAAMVGVIALGLVIVELAGVLAAVGALAQIPGLEWLINESAGMMQAIGNAIGSLIGGIMGGIGKGISSALPAMAKDLSEFMVNLQPFIDGAKLIDSSVLDGTKALVGVILALTAADILDGLTSWFTGGSSLAEFGKEIAEFGPYLKEYGDAVAGIDVAAIQASVYAARALADVAKIVPNEGGVVGWLAGENSIAKFGKELPALGQGLKGFSDSVAGISPENIVAAAEAAKSIADMSSVIPNEGGVVSWFAGDNSLAQFSTEIIALGYGLKGFSDAIEGVVPANIIAAASAASALADMTSTIPNEGGVVSWFAGDNAISNFAYDIIQLGIGLKGFSDAIVGIVPENIESAAQAAKALAEMTKIIPNEGGAVSWFTGDNSISKFGTDLISLGKGLKGFSDAIVGIVPENITSASIAAKSLAEMTKIIPNEGGVVSWFTGENSISKFGTDIVALGHGLKGFSDAVVGIVPDNIVAAANAAKALAEMSAIIPSEGGVVSWFAGDKSLSKFGTDMVALGKGLKGFSDAVTGLVPGNITAAASAATSLANMASTIPSQDGIAAWFTGENNIAKFADQLPKLGTGLKGFSDSVAGIVPDNITSAASAAKALAEMTAVIPSQDGIVAWFTGENNISKFAGQLPDLGSGLKGFSDSVEGLNPENTKAAASAAKSLGDMTSVIPKNTNKIVDFGKHLIDFGKNLSSYFDKTKGITPEAVNASKSAINAVEDVADLNSGNIKATAKAIDDVVDAIKGMSKITKNTTSEFVKALKEMGKASSEALVKEFEDIDDDMKKAGKKAMESFVDGVEKEESKAKTACKDMVKACADAISNKASEFKTAAKNLVKGFANGIDQNTYLATARAKAMAKAAADAAKKELDEHSPSKVGYEIGDFFGVAFVNAIGDNVKAAYDSSAEMAKSAKSGLKETLSRIGDAMGSDIDVNPTIRPVLDLSDIRSGARSIGDILGSGSLLGVSANIGSISSMMNHRNQNGTNGELLSAIGRLGKELKNAGNTYNINGVSYEEGSDVADAFKTIIRAAKIERRT